MVLSLIVAIADNGIIGNKNDLPWRQSADLKFFKATTSGHPVIMGRTTHEAIGKPLPNRRNIVVTRNPDFVAPGCEVAHSIQEAIALVHKEDEAFIMGGANIYEQSIELADKLYLTEVHAEPEGDAFFDYKPALWQEVAREDFSADEKNQYDYSFVTFEKIV